MLYHNVYGMFLLINEYIAMMSMNYRYDETCETQRLNHPNSKHEYVKQVTELSK